MYSYTVTKYDRAGITAVLSAQWDTLRDAALAAKLHYNINQSQFIALLAGGSVIHNGQTITVSETPTCPETKTKWQNANPGAAHPVMDV